LSTLLSVETTYIAYANPEVKPTVQEPAFPFCISTFQNTLSASSIFYNPWHPPC